MTAAVAMQPAPVAEKREFRSPPGLPGRMVLISTTRARRAAAAPTPAVRAASHVATCPFCVGNEGRTPPEIARVESGGHWQLRVIENLFPAVGPAAGVPSAHDALRFPATGVHEVIVDHPDHGIGLAEMPVAHIASLLTMFRQRGAALLGAHPQVQCVLAFKNAGRAAGGSIEHSHSQVIALEVVPPGLHSAVPAAQQQHSRGGTCPQCDATAQALSGDEDAAATLVDRSARFAVLKPAAGRSEWELHLVPLAHHDSYYTTGPVAIEELSLLLRTTMQRLLAVVGPFDYNLCVVSAPRNARFHWRIEIHPRTATPMAVEIGWGLPLHSVCPEQAAARLRDALPPTGTAVAPAPRAGQDAPHCAAAPRFSPENARPS